MGKRFWKFEFADALGDCGAFTPTEIATLRYLCDRADEKGKCFPTLKTINEACGRSASYPMTAHIKKAEQLGFLKVGGHGRKRIYYLNTSIQGIKSAVKSASQQQVSNSKSADTTPKSAETGGSSQHQSPTNTSTNTSTNTPTKEGSVKRNKLKEEVAKAKHYHSLDYKPSRVDLSSFPDVRREAEARYDYLIRKGLKRDTPFQENLNWFVEWVRDEEINLDLLTWLFLNFSTKVSDLTSYPYFTKKKLTLSLYQDYEERAGFVAGRESVEVVLPTIEKRLTRRGVEVVAL